MNSGFRGLRVAWHGLAAVEKRCLPTSTQQVRRAVSGTVQDDRAQGRFYPHQSVCRATIVGRTGAVPKQNFYENGGSSLNFSIAVNERKAGTEQEDPVVNTQWMRVFVSDSTPGSLAFLAELRPGSLVFVDGNLRIRKVLKDDGTYQDFVNIHVGRTGTFQVLKQPYSEESADSFASSDMPF